MAKYCRSCNQDFADDQLACPHCGTPETAAAPADSGVVELVDEGISPASSEEIDLDMLEETGTGSDIVQLVSPAEGSSIEITEALLSGEPAPGPEGPRSAPTTTQGGAARPPTVDLGGVHRPETMLAMPRDVTTGGPPKTTQLGSPVRPPTMLATPGDEESALAGGPENKDAARHTHVARSSGPPTMLARPTGEETGAGASEGPKKTQLGAGRPPTLPDEADAGSERKKTRLKGGLVETNLDLDIGDAPEVPASAFPEERPAHGGDSSIVEIGDVSESPAPPALRARAASAAETGALADIGAAAADEEPAKTEPEPVDQPAARKQRAKGRSGALAWVGGGVAGAVIGAAASIALLVAGVLPAESLGITPKRTAAGTPAAGPGPAAPPRPAAAPPAASPPAVVPAGPTTAQHLDRGDWEEALQGYDKLEKPSADELAARGQARWLRYLQKHAGQPIDPKDPDVAKARQDLEKANNAPATYWLGQMAEAEGNEAEARRRYEKGLQQHPRDRARFQAALDRLEARQQEKGDGTQSRAPTAAPLLVGTFLVAEEKAPTSQEAKPEKPGGEPDEAGFEFWKAVRLARRGEYGPALAALKGARQAHEQRRYLRLYKAQNPLSDPTEEIFRRSCDELAAYWTLKQRLGETGIAKGDPVRAVDALLKDHKEVETLRAQVEELRTQKEAAEKQAVAAKRAREQARPAPEPKDNTAKLAQLADQRRQAEDALNRARAALKAAGYEGQSDDVADAVKSALSAREIDRDRFKETVVRLDSDERLLKALTAKLRDAGVLDPGAGPSALLTAVEPLLQRRAGPRAADEKREPQADATQAAVQYEAGYRLYWSGRYPEAERAFAAAVKMDAGDARYFYYLGLARLQQGKRAEAAEAFRRGGRLEMQNKPPGPALGVALERVQGDARRTLDRESLRLSEEK